jgi:hypothetical protein
MLVGQMFVQNATALKLLYKHLVSFLKEDSTYYCNICQELAIGSNRINYR